MEDHDLVAVERYAVLGVPGHRPSGRSPMPLAGEDVRRVLDEELETAYTIPGLSGRDSMSTYS